MNSWVISNFFRDVTKTGNRERGMGNRGSGDETWEGENERWEHNREFKMKFLILGLDFKRGLFPIFLFAFLVLVPRFQFPVLVIVVIFNNSHCFYCSF